MSETINTLCDTCASNAKRSSVTLCEACAKNFRVIFLPSDVRVWEEIASDATDADGDGVAAEELVRGLQVRMFNQQRELSKLNKRLSEHRAIVRGYIVGLQQAMRVPQSQELKEVQVMFDAACQLRRYHWLRDGHTQDVSGAKGEALDLLCDAGVREFYGVKT